MESTRRFVAPVALVGLFVSISFPGVGCGSSNNDPAGAGAGGASGSGGATAGVGGVDADAAASPYCTAKPPVDPSPDLSGKWAWMTVGSLQEPKTALTPAFRTRTVSLLLSDQTQTGANVTMNLSYCDQYDEEEAGALSHVILPDTYKRSLAPFTRTGTYAAQTDGGTAALTSPSVVQVVGAHLTDPVNGALPTVSTDPQVFDQDGDGNPGATIKIGGVVGGDLYVVQRQVTTIDAIATSADRLEGVYGYQSEQTILGSNPATFKDLANSQKAIPDSTPCASRVMMVRVAATTTCADVVAGAATLFQ